MIAVPLNNSNTLNQDLLEPLKDFIKEILTKYKLNKIEKELNSIITTFEPLKDKDIIIQNENDVEKFEKFSDELSDLEDFLENLEDLRIDNKVIRDKIDKALDIIVPLNCRVAGNIADYEMRELCK
jgi:Asp-tRNA(Asn)/Glu-tRNA(Gln) amidotransferase C subunit